MTTPAKVADRGRKFFQIKNKRTAIIPYVIAALKRR